MCISKLNECHKCDISWLRKNVVKGTGNENAAIMVIGEAPGYYEDKLGIPFIGLAGKKLTKHLTEVGFNKDDIWLTTIIKCRPKANRTPTITEMNNCREYLKYEITNVKPWIIVPVGLVVIRTFIPTAMEIGSLHGKAIKINNTYIIPMFNPSQALNQKAIDTACLNDWDKVRALYLAMLNERSNNSSI